MNFKTILLTIILFTIISFFPKQVNAFPTFSNANDVMNAVDEGLVGDLFHEMYPTSTCEEVNFLVYKVPAHNYFHFSSPEKVMFTFYTDWSTCETSTSTTLSIYSYENVNYLRPSNVQIAWCGSATGFSTFSNPSCSGTNQRNSFHRGYRPSTVAKSTVRIGKDSTSNWNLNFGSYYDNLGLTASIGPYLFVPVTNNPDGTVYESEPTIDASKRYYIEYNNTEFDAYYRLESDNKCTINEVISTGDYEFSCTGNWSMYTMYMTDKFLTPTGSDEYPPYLKIEDTNTPCSNIIASNYVLADTNSNLVCKATSSVLVDDIAPPISGIINFDSSSYDWGTFDFLLEPAQLFFDAIDSIVLWFYDLWRGLLSLIIPEPDILAWTFQEVKIIAKEKFQNIDVSSLAVLGHIDTSTMPDIRTTLMGIQVPIIKFDLIDDNISVIRPILIATIGFFLIIFNVNQVNKLLADTTVTQ